MESNWKREFIVSIYTFLFVNIFNFISLGAIFYFFNIYVYPPTFGVLFWIGLIMILLVSNYFIIKLILKNKKLSIRRQDIILYSSVILNIISLFTFLNLLETVNFKSATIKNIEMVKSSNTLEYDIENFEISKNPRIYSRIKKETKPLRKYAEVFYTFPFKSEIPDIYFSLLFKERINVDLSFDEEREALNKLINKSRDSLENYDFQKIKKFQVLTEMYRERGGFQMTIRKAEQTPIFLMPVEKSLKSNFEESKIFTIKILTGIFIMYVFIFFLTRLEQWK